MHIMGPSPEVEGSWEMLFLVFAWDQAQQLRGLGSGW